MDVTENPESRVFVVRPIVRESEQSNKNHFKTGMVSTQFLSFYLDKNNNLETLWCETIISFIYTRSNNNLPYEIYVETALKLLLTYSETNQ